MPPQSGWWASTRLLGFEDHRADGPLARACAQAGACARARMLAIACARRMHANTTHPHITYTQVRHAECLPQVLSIVLNPTSSLVTWMPSVLEHKSGRVYTVTLVA